MVCRYFGRPVSLPRIRELVHTSTDGTSLPGSRAAPRSSGSTRARSAPRRAGSTSCRCRRSCTGRETTGSCSTRSARATCGSPTRRAGSARSTARRVPRELERLRGADRARRRAFEELPEAQPSLAWLKPFLRPHRGRCVKAVAAGARRGRRSSSCSRSSRRSSSTTRCRNANTESARRDPARRSLGVLVVIIGATIVQRYLLAFVAVRFDTASARLPHRRCSSLPMTYFATRRTGDIERRLAGVREVRQFLVAERRHGADRGHAARSRRSCSCSSTAGCSRSSTSRSRRVYAVLMRFSSTRLRPMFDNLEEAFGRTPRSRSTRSAASRR